MKRIIIAMAAIVAAFTMASCNKEQLVEPENNITPTEGSCIITASTESNLTKTSLDGNDTDGYNVVWSEGDSFVIGGNTFTLTAGEGTTNGTFEGTAPLDGTYDVYYPSTYDGSTWPSEQTYTEGNIIGSPMKAEVTITDGKASESIKFKNEGGILRLTVKGTATVTSINVSATELSKAITLNCEDGVELNNTDGTVFHIAMPAGSYSNTSIQFTSASGSICTKKLKSKTLDIECSKISPASFSASFITTGSAEPLPGMFTVANGRQVQFSQGNLICDISGETPKWGFYESQYGYATGYSSTLISLFNWGYDPVESLYPGSSISNTINNLTGNYLPQEKDWGSQIGDGKTWRTLTGEEWKYLFETRTNAADKYGYATVGGVYGLIILPDIFTDPMKNGGSGAFVPKTTTGWNANVYATGGDWEAMESAGAVFLPAAGSRSGSSLSYVGSSGRYWSSSHKTNSSPYHLFFDSSLVNSNSYGGATTGMSVRLVTNLYTVTFDMNGETGTAPESFEGIPYGSKITYPSDPTGARYVFAGWYKDEVCTKAWDFNSDVITNDITLYAKWDEETLSGKFTINSDGKQVHFSAGNLTYNTTNNKWAFYKKQTGCAYGYDDPLVSQFTWGYGTWSTNQNTNEYITGQEFVDWGTKIGDGRTWYTLSIEEWSYLVNTRKVKGKTGSGNTCVMATIDGMYGMIIFCDGYQGETTNLTAIPNGCAFLPAAGVRYVFAGLIQGLGSQGEYWSRTPNAPNSDSYYYAYYFTFNENGLWTELFHKGHPRSVRLVKDVKAE